MNSYKLIFNCLILISLTACACQKIKPIDAGSLNAVHAEIKREVGVYMAASHYRRPIVMINNIPTPIDQIPDPKFMCGNGQINFDISSIKAELTTSLDSTSGFKAGLVLPLSSVGQTNENVSTRVLDYSVWPLSWDSQSDDFKKYIPTDDDIVKAPIAQELLIVRDTLIASALNMDYSSKPPRLRSNQPCFTDYNPANPATDAGNSLKLALTSTTDTSGAVSFVVAPISFGPTGEIKSTTGNTITVIFNQSGLESIQKQKDVVDAECKYLKGEGASEKQACGEAKGKLNQISIGHGGVMFYHPKTQ